VTRSGGPTSPSPDQQPARSRKALRVDSGKVYVCGRPPYGYKVIDGALAPQPAQQEAVLLAFRMAEHQSSLREIVSALQGKYRRGADGQEQFWDRVKLKRIWAHILLYTRGRYQAPRGQVQELPSLSFMPEAYERVPYPSPPMRAAAAMADIPSRPGKSKMGGHASSSSRRKS